MTSTPTPATTADLAAIADDMWERIQNLFLVESEQLYLEHFPAQGSDNAFSYLWPFTGVFSAANARAALRRDDAAIAGLRQTLDSLERYWDADADPPGYDSYVVDYGGGDKFYDDNEWLGIDFVYAHRLLDDPSLLDKAIAMWTFAISGWTDDEMDGGIYWKQGDHSTKNTCSNGPAAVLALMLYEETGDDQYLDWATRILDWLDVLRDDATGVFNDNIRDDGTIDEAKYTYNAGTPLHAYALLFRITGDEAWLSKARELAAASLAYFAPATVGDGVPWFPNTPWFNSILHRGYRELYAVDPEGDRRFVDAMNRFLLHGLAHARDDNGLLDPDWGVSTPTDSPRWLLDQTPVIEIAARSALTDSD